MPFITSGDLNSDGVVDLVVADRDAGFISVLLGTVSGTFLAPTNYSTGSGSRMVKLADFNNDGTLDIAVTSQASQYVSVLLWLSLLL
ncbi:FG-GAP repeat domain-containing protein [Bradyrhizobium diazoefficiens]